MTQETAQKILQINRESYAHIAHDFDKTRSAPWEDFSIFGPFVKENMQVLDVGCGNGRLYSALRTHNVSYTGIDQNTYFIEAARARYPEARFFVGDSVHLESTAELSDEKFDCIFCVAVFSHIPSHEMRLQMLSQMRSFLKPGGALLMLNWNLWRLGKKQKNIWTSIVPRISMKEQEWEALYRLNRNDLAFRDVMTLWGDRKNLSPLYYRALSSGEVNALCHEAGFGEAQSFYTARGKEAHWWDGRNIATIAHN